MTEYDLFSRDLEEQESEARRADERHWDKQDAMRRHNADLDNARQVFVWCFLAAAAMGLLLGILGL